VGFRQVPARPRPAAQALPGGQVDLEPGQRRDLLEDGDPDRSLDEPFSTGIGDQVCNPAKHLERKNATYSADQKREREDQRQAFSRRRDARHGRRGEHHHGRVRPHHEEPRAAEDRVGDERQRERVEADHGVDAEQARVGERQRDEHGPYCCSRDEVAG
jgi:hypothetical protein